jgi:peptidyl-prolyl cis-trans isomerase B (cyclophilin B)
MNRFVLGGIVVVVVVVVGGLIYIMRQDKASVASQNAYDSDTQQSVATPVAGESVASTTITSEKNMIATITTNKGVMEIVLDSSVAPETVKNFVKLAESGFYNGTAFHRIVKGFMIQGGDPLTKDLSASDRYGTGGPGYMIKAEFNDTKHVRGVISMARSADPNSAGSQFFICLDDATFLDRQYTAFGHIRAGEDVLMAIGNVPTKMNASGTEKSVPTERIVIEKITIASQ